MIQIAEMLGPQPDSLWTLMSQAGVRHAVTGLGGRRDAPRPGAEQPWDFTPMMRLKQRFADHGYDVAVIESSPPMNDIKLAGPERDQQIEYFQTMLRSMGAVGIPAVCYNWMVGLGWTRTSFTTPARAGALTSSYDHDLMRNAPLTPIGEVSEEFLWDNLEYFLRAVVPVAEEAGVKLAMHPDDPPLSPIRGVGRIMRSGENYQRLIDLVPSPSNGITMCQGNFALITDDLPATIRHFGKQGAIHFVHFRDVRGTPEKFVELFHDAAEHDLLECMRAYRDIGYDGVLRSDHVPTLEGDSNDRPGYSSIGRLLAIGYIKGIREAAYRYPADAPTGPRPPA